MAEQKTNTQSTVEALLSFCAWQQKEIANLREKLEKASLPKKEEQIISIPVNEYMERIVNNINTHLTNHCLIVVGFESDKTHLRLRVRSSGSEQYTNIRFFDKPTGTSKVIMTTATDEIFESNVYQFTHAPDYSDIPQCITFVNDNRHTWCVYPA